MCHFPILDLGGGGLGFPFILSKIAILAKIKWNSKPPSPPNQGWNHAKDKNVPFSHPWFGGGGGGGGGGLGFPFILSKIVGDWWRVRIRGSQQHIPTQTFLKYLPRFGSFLFLQSLDPPLFFLLWRPGLRDKWTPYYGIKQPVIKVPKFIVEKNNIIL